MKGKIRVFFFKQRTGYEIRLSLVGSEICIGDRIYPSIREVAKVEVRSRRLDTLLAEEGLAAAAFNFLNLDIQ